MFRYARWGTRVAVAGSEALSNHVLSYVEGTAYPDERPLPVFKAGDSDDGIN